VSTEYPSSTRIFLKLSKITSSSSTQRILAFGLLTSARFNDFAKKLIGSIDDIEFPNLGMNIKVDQPLFSIKQGRRHITFGSPISGNVTAINDDLEDNIDSLDISPYEQNWICKIDAENLDMEIKDLKIGNSAVSFYQEDIEKYQNEVQNLSEEKDGEDKHLFEGEFANLDDYNFNKLVSEFFSR